MSQSYFELSEWDAFAAKWCRWFTKVPAGEANGDCFCLDEWEGKGIA